MKKAVSLMMVLLVVLSMFVLAQEASGENPPSAPDHPPQEGSSEEISLDKVPDRCAGFLGSIKCFLFGRGSEEKALVGKAGGIWGREEALVGKAGDVCEGVACGKGTVLNAQGLGISVPLEITQGADENGVIEGKYGDTPVRFKINDDGTFEIVEVETTLGDETKWVLVEEMSSLVQIDTITVRGTVLRNANPPAAAAAPAPAEGEAPEAEVSAPAAPAAEPAPAAGEALEAAAPAAGEREAENGEKVWFYNPETQDFEKSPISAEDVRSLYDIQEGEQPDELFIRISATKPSIDEREVVRQQEDLKDFDTGRLQALVADENEPVENREAAKRILLERREVSAPPERGTIQAAEAPPKAKPKDYTPEGYLTRARKDGGTKTAMDSLGITDVAGVRTFQEKEIEKMPNTHVCNAGQRKCWTDSKKGTEVICIGTIGNGKCVADGKLGSKTKKAMMEAVTAQRVSEAAAGEGSEKGGPAPAAAPVVAPATSNQFSVGGKTYHAYLDGEWVIVDVGEREGENRYAYDGDDLKYFDTKKKDWVAAAVEGDTWKIELKGKLKAVYEGRTGASPQLSASLNAQQMLGFGVLKRHEGNIDWGKAECKEGVCTYPLSGGIGKVEGQREAATGMMTITTKIKSKPGREVEETTTFYSPNGDTLGSQTAEQKKAGQVALWGGEQVFYYKTGEKPEELFKAEKKKRIELWETAEERDRNEKPDRYIEREGNGVDFGHVGAIYDNGITYRFEGGQLAETEEWDNQLGRKGIVKDAQGKTTELRDYDEGKVELFDPNRDGRFSGSGKLKKDGTWEWKVEYMPPARGEKRGKIRVTNAEGKVIEVDPTTQREEIIRHVEEGDRGERQVQAERELGTVREEHEKAFRKRDRATNLWSEKKRIKSSGEEAIQGVGREIDQLGQQITVQEGEVQKFQKHVDNFGSAGYWEGGFETPIKTRESQSYGSQREALVAWAGEISNFERFEVMVGERITGSSIDEKTRGKLETLHRAVQARKKEEAKLESLKGARGAKRVEFNTINEENTILTDFISGSLNEGALEDRTTQEILVRGLGFSNVEEYARRHNIMGKENKVDNIKLVAALKGEQSEFAAITEQPSDEELEAAGERVRAAEGEAEGEGREAAQAAQGAFEQNEGWQAGLQTTLESVYAIADSIKSYPAINNLLFGEEEWYQNWQREMDQAFAPMLGSNWFPSAICEGWEKYNIEPEGKAMIKTPTGTYQAVASIQLERSDDESPVLCTKNPDEEAEEEWVCEGKDSEGKDLICVDDSFCYKDNDEDGEPDEDEPATGYFYKITWGVSSPRDEAMTPFRDENGVAVSFNVWLYKGSDVTGGRGDIYLYKREGSTAGPVELKNGESDRDVVVHYSGEEYNSACIVWDKAPVTTEKGEGGLSAPWSVMGTEEVPDVCINREISSVGQVSWEKSDKESAGTSSKVSEGKVEKNKGW